jgi:hypothetical protein
MALKYHTKRDGKVCDCYVAELADMVQMSLHYGAHAPTCPVYRISRDPVDAKRDIQIRREYTQEQYS